jgi:hypothetical protein
MLPTRIAQLRLSRLAGVLLHAGFCIMSRRQAGASLVSLTDLDLNRHRCSTDMPSSAGHMLLSSVVVFIAVWFVQHVTAARQGTAWSL